MKTGTRIWLATAMTSLILLAVTALAGSSSTFETIKANGTLYSTKGSVLTLQTSIAEADVAGISIEDASGNMKASEFHLEGSRLYINPSRDLVGGKVYTIKVFTSSGKKYQIKATAKDDVNINHSKDNVIKISAKPEKGYNYPYYLLIPKGTLENSLKKYMVVEPNNSGYPSDSLTFHEIAVRIHMHDYGYTTGGAGGYQVATELKTPLLMPVFPRPTTEDGAGIYTHALDREAMTVTGADYERVDLQLIAMINDARALLADHGIALEQKVFMVGFSASGDFVNRFMFMYPELVKAIASSTSTIFPAASYEGVTLKYPLGIADIKSFTGKPFNAAEFRKIAKFIYTGDQDRNDEVTNEWDRNGQEYVAAMRRLFGEELFPDKWNKKIEIINDLGYGESYQFHIYKGIGHAISSGMYDDIVRFFKANMGSEIKKITPKEYAN